jgi:hypothetical protein
LSTAYRPGIIFDNINLHKSPPNSAGGAIMVRKKVLIRKRDGQVRVIKEGALEKAKKPNENSEIERKGEFLKNVEKDMDEEIAKG